VSFPLLTALALLQTQMPVSVYQRAEQMLPPRAAELVLRDKIVPRWIGASDRFWYRVTTGRGVEFVMVDPARRLRQPAFDHSRMAAALAAAANSAVSGDSLPVSNLEWDAAAKPIAAELSLQGTAWRCVLPDYRCQADTTPPADPNELRSPDGRWALFRQDHQLFVRRTDTGERRQLTTDGALRNEYGAETQSSTEWVTNRRMGVPTPPIARWSSDSRLVLVQQIDEREVPETYLIQTVGVPRPKLWSFAYSIVGDPQPRGTWWIFDVASGRAVNAEGPGMSVPFVPTIDLGEAWWGDSTGSVAYYIERERGSRAWWLKAIDAESGRVRTIAEERGPTMTEPSPAVGMAPLVHVTEDGREVIWYSERDGWGHLYMVDAATGATIRQLTKGSWAVLAIVKADDRERRVWFLAGGREPDRNPYHLQLYSVGYDGADLRLLTPENAHHQITLGAGGRWVVDRISRPDLAPVTVARSLDGKDVVPLERADLTRLLATGWRWPEPFVAKAADGVTDIYGILFLPSNFDSTRRYPVVEEIYPGPQRTNVPRSFDAGIDDRALAELGMIGVRIDGRGTPFRSKAFHDYAYGRLETVGGLEDHIAAYRQIAASRPYLDLDRVGIYGSSGGGFGSVRAMLDYPDFYRVGVSIVGDHDVKGYLGFWGETYQGPPDSASYARASNLPVAGNLKGKLLLAYGELDDNVPPAQTLRLIDALTRANRDYDLLVVPNASHYAAANGYFRRRRWDYFVEHLLGLKPPPNYLITAPPEYPHAGTQPQ